jgi:hypothetical protein
MNLVAAKKERRKPPRKQNGQGVGPRWIDGAALDVRGASVFYGGTEKRTRGYVARRQIPFRRLGGRIIFLRAELEQWLTTLDGCTLDEARTNLEARHERA